MQKIVDIPTMPVTPARPPDPSTSRAEKTGSEKERSKKDQHPERRRKRPDDGAGHIDEYA